MHIHVVSTTAKIRDALEQNSNTVRQLQRYHKSFLADEV